jgi:hypothetical protein
VNQNELYNIKADPGQKQNVAGENPGVVKELQLRYEQFWNEMGEGESAPQRAVIGSGKIAETWLTCDGWIPDTISPQTWDQLHVNHAARSFGYWPVTIAKEGTCLIEVRRWPKELKCPINSAPAVPISGDIYNKNKPVLMGQGKIIHAAKVRLKVGDEFFEQDINPADEQANFNITLKKGNTEIQAWLIDSLGYKNPAYYVYVIENSMDEK